MKRPYKLGEILIDLEEVAAVEDIDKRDCGMRLGFALVLRSGYKAQAFEYSSDEGRKKLTERRNRILRLLETPEPVIE